MKISLALLSCFVGFVPGKAVSAEEVPAVHAPLAVEQWDLFEVSLHGPADGNPFTDVQLTATFTNGARSVDVAGFYDGGGVYRVRFLPAEQGTWHFETHSNRWPLTARRGTFTVTAPSAGNHGPVGVRNTYHFGYADGTPFHQIGTTSYTWTHRTEAMQEQTLQTLAASPFNKLRMCVFPQSHGIALMPPTSWPFEGAPRQFDFTRFNPEFFQHLEKRVGQLRDLGIECDLILFHPYDGAEEWGFETMDAASDDRYLRYVVARLAAFRNIWWSLANEYDYLRTKSEADWDRFFQIVQREDPYGHLRSIHNGSRLYNYTLPWVTHVSLQLGAAVTDAGRAELFREVYRKPVVFDEAKYEGDSVFQWANLSAQEMVHRFWAGTVAGTYVGHSEYFGKPNDVVWLGQGGVLRGESAARLAFLRKIMETGPADGIEPIDQWSDAFAWRQRPVEPALAEVHIGGQPGEFYLVYFGRGAPRSWSVELPRFNLDDGARFQADLLDAWNMTITPVPGEITLKRKLETYNAFDPMFVGENGRTIELPGQPYIAIRLRRLR